MAARTSLGALLLSLPVGLLGLGAGCGFNTITSGRPPGGSASDLGAGSEPDALPAVDAAGGGPADPCLDRVKDPTCTGQSFGPPASPFPLQSDPHANPAESDQGVARDPMGYLTLASTGSRLNYLWIANATDNGAAGSVSKIDARAVREVARYLTVTCSSLPGGSADPCDGTRGCCAVDDWARYQARRAGKPAPGHQAVQLGANYPSRTAVDFNGDLFISNRAFGGQSSVTRIANDAAECLDRNHNGRIDSSRDQDGDGWIAEDCNGDGLPDDLAGVRAHPCTNGLPQEFYGLDDECVLWTANTFPGGAVGRPLGLSAGANDATASDVWAGSFQLGRFVRLDGTTGLAQKDTLLPPECHDGSGPYGLAIDADGIGWAPTLGAGKLCYFDTRHPDQVGSVRDPKWGQMQGYGITLDRDQNVWVGMGVERYTPDRSNGFANLGTGYWTAVLSTTGIGIAADSRTARDYFVWSCTGSRVLRIPASSLAPMKQDVQVNPRAWLSIAMPCYGVGVDADQNVWGVDMTTTTRALVDLAGNITQPTVNGAPRGNDRCPAGDSCPNAGAYTYSDFTGFGLRNFTRPQGSWSLIVPGCQGPGGAPQDTEWDALSFDADLPANTSLLVHARSANRADPADASWGQAPWTTPNGVSPVALQAGLTPNLHPGDTATRNDAFLQVEFLFRTQVQSASPRLKSFTIAFKCSRNPG